MGTVEDPLPPLQQRVSSWHADRFPEAQPFHVALKAMEEMGEVAEALNGHLSGGRGNEATSRRGDVPKEAADVAVCLMVLLGRWFPERDLLAEVEDKLAVLTNPDSGHRSSVRAAGCACPCHKGHAKHGGPCRCERPSSRLDWIKH